MVEIVDGVHYLGAPLKMGNNTHLRMELAGSGITVNMIAPGWIPVERHQDHSPESLRRYAANVPAGRMGTPNDVAHAVVYLASPEASFVTGQTLSVNGGNTVLRSAIGEAMSVTATSGS